MVRQQSSLGSDTSKIISFLRQCHIMLFSATFPTTVREYALKVDDVPCLGHG